MTTSTTIELNDLHTDADSGGGGPSGDLRKFKDVKEKSARGKSARLTAHIQFSIATEGDTERAFRKSESDPGAQKSSSTEGDGGRASQTKCKREFHHSNSYPDGGATLGREGPQMSLCQAVKDGNTDEVEKWLKYDKKRVRVQDKHGYAPVHYAAKFNRLKILQMLHKDGKADMTVKTISEEYTPLHLAARLIPQKPASQTCCDTDRVVPDSSGPNTSTIIGYLKRCEDVNVNAKDSYDITPLHLACQAGNLEGVRSLLEECDADVMMQDSNGDTPLHEACLHGEKIIFDLLLSKMTEKSVGLGLGSQGERKINLVIKNRLGLTPFHFACRGGHLEIAEKLYDHSDNPEALVREKDKEGETALHLACQKDQPNVVEFLLSKGANVFAHKNDGMTPVHIASKHGCIGVMNSLLKHDETINVNVRDRYDQTPLHFAAECGQVKMIQLLLDNDADIEAKDNDHYTPLLTAAEFGQKEAFECLMSKGDGAKMIAVQNKDKNSTLFLAAESNHPDLVKIILQRDEGKKLLSVADTCLNTPLLIAAKKGHIKPIEEILRYQDRFRVDTNLSRKTAMHLAAENGHTDVVKMLIDHNCDLMKYVDVDGNTPLHLACMHGYEEVALYLMKNHADIGARNKVLWTPLDCAASNGHARVIERLVNFKAGSDIDPKDKLNTTPLHLAAKEGHVTAVETLIKYGARVSDRDYRGFNALDWAIENGHSNVAEAIVNSPKWKLALSNHITMENGTETTPFRKLIERIPDVAELVLKKCTITKSKESLQPGSKKYSVTFNYEFIEDKDLAKMWKDESDVESLRTTPKELEAGNSESKWQWVKQKGLHFLRRRKQKYLRCWGHSRLSHPLKIMVKSQRTELLKHPLVYNLIEHKWDKFGRPIFYMLLICHIAFVIFLTAFALELLNPFSPTCTVVSSGRFNIAQAEEQIPLNLSQLEAPNEAAMVMGYLTDESIILANNTAYVDGKFLCSSNMSETVRDAIDGIIPIDPICGLCGLSIHDIRFIKIAAGIIILFSTIRLLLEILWLIRQVHLYFADFGICTLVEVPLFVSAVIFAVVFDRECLCPRDWQWQVGIVAVFLVWIDLLLYMRRMRILDTGIYVLMFEAIFKTFLKVILLTVLLVVTFALTFYMAFNQFIPRFSRSPFASPFTSMWKTMTMATGELGYDDIFRQFTDDPISSPPGVPFPAISYVMWVIFLILMPILFTNLLVGLAVDDIKGILDAAALTRLALRVDLVLGIEDYFWFLPRIQHHMKDKQLDVKPYKNRVRRFFAPLMRLMRGEDYCSAKHIANMLNPVKSPSEQQSQALMHEMVNMKQELSRVVNELERSQGISCTPQEAHDDQSHAHWHTTEEVQAQTVSPSATSTSEQQTLALMHRLAKMHEDTQQEMAKMQQHTQQEMAKMHTALQTLSQIVQEYIQH